MVSNVCFLIGFFSFIHSLTHSLTLHYITLARAAKTEISHALLHTNHVKQQQQQQQHQCLIKFEEYSEPTIIDSNELNKFNLFTI